MFCNHSSSFLTSIISWTMSIFHVSSGFTIAIHDFFNILFLNIFYFVFPESFCNILYCVWTCSFVISIAVFEVAAFARLDPSLLASSLMSFIRPWEKPPIPLPFCWISPPLKLMVWMLITCFGGVWMLITWFGGCWGTLIWLDRFIAWAEYPLE